MKNRILSFLYCPMTSFFEWVSGKDLAPLKFHLMHGLRRDLFYLCLFVFRQEIKVGGNTICMSTGIVFYSCQIFAILMIRFENLYYLIFKRLKIFQEYYIVVKLRFAQFYFYFTG